MNTTRFFWLVPLAFVLLGCSVGIVPAPTPLPPTETVAATAAAPPTDTPPTATAVPPTETPLPVPTAVPPTPTATVCVPTPQPGWVAYTVQSGDTLFRLARAGGTTVAELIQANCRVDDVIYVGEVLYMPPGSVGGAAPPPPSPPTVPPPPPPMPTLPPPPPPTPTRLILPPPRLP